MPLSYVLLWLKAYNANNSAIMEAFPVVMVQAGHGEEVLTHSGG